MSKRAKTNLLERGMYSLDYIIKKLYATIVTNNINQHRHIGKNTPVN